MFAPLNWAHLWIINESTARAAELGQTVPKTALGMDSWQWRDKALKCSRPSCARASGLHNLEAKREDGRQIRDVAGEDGQQYPWIRQIMSPPRCIGDQIAPRCHVLSMPYATLDGAPAAQNGANPAGAAASGLSAGCNSSWQEQANSVSSASHRKSFSNSHSIVQTHQTPVPSPNNRIVAPFIFSKSIPRRT